MRKTIIIGNWKMNKNATDTKTFINEFSSTIFNKRSNTIYGIAIPSINIPIASVIKEAKQNNDNLKQLSICAQNISQYDNGAYTGEISANMLKSYAIEYVIIGHSERRLYNHETNSDINKKAKQCISNGIIPIICVGETLEEYEASKSKEIVREQIINSCADLDYKKIVVAYEPVWAIGTGKTATFQYAQEMCKFIRELTSDELLIQYGGSVNGDNISKLLEQPDVDGALVGGASLKIDSFIDLIKGE